MKHIGYVVILISLCVSCGGSSEPSKSPEELLTAHHWYLYEYERIDYYWPGEPNYYFVITFRDDGVAVMTDERGISHNYYWEYNADENIVYLGDIVLHVLELEEKKFVYKTQLFLDVKDMCIFRMSNKPVDEVKVIKRKYF